MLIKNKTEYLIYLFLMKQSRNHSSQFKCARNKHLFINLRSCKPIKCIATIQYLFHYSRCICKNNVSLYTIQLQAYSERTVNMELLLKRWNWSGGTGIKIFEKIHKASEINFSLTCRKNNPLKKKKKPRQEILPLVRTLNSSLRNKSWNAFKSSLMQFTLTSNLKTLRQFSLFKTIWYLNKSLFCN